MSLSPAELLEAHELMHAAGWTDGLPVVPPHRELVEEFVRASGRAGDELIGEVPPLGGEATVERVAANAVMAGCKPAYLPVVITAVEAMLDPRFNLNGMQCSTHMATPLVIVHGPIRQELDVNCGANVFGQGWRANATIGRAVKLVLVNIGGARPGLTDKSTLGHPGKYTYCIAENEAESPWPPFHVEQGHRPEQSAVTVFAAEAPHNINNHAFDPYRLCDAIAGTITTLGANNYYVMGDYTIVLGVDHARILDQAGWKRRHVQRYLFEKARLPVGRLRYGGMYVEHLERNLWPRWIEREDDTSLVPPVREPEDFKIFVAGGAGPHSVVIPGWGTRAITRPIG